MTTMLVGLVIGALLVGTRIGRLVLRAGLWGVVIVVTVAGCLLWYTVLIRGLLWLQAFLQ